MNNSPRLEKHKTCFGVVTFFLFNKVHPKNKNKRAIPLIFKHHYLCFGVVTFFLFNQKDHSLKRKVINTYNHDIVTIVYKCLEVLPILRSYIIQISTYIFLQNSFTKEVTLFFII